jgi:hypothetical protein
MYAEISQRPPPPRPFLNLLRSPVHLPLRCLMRALLRLSTVVVGAFSNTHHRDLSSRTCRARSRPSDPDSHRPHPAEQPWGRPTLWSVAMVLLDDPAAREANHEAAHHPLSLRVTRLQRLPGIGTIGLIQVLAGISHPHYFGATDQRVPLIRPNTADRRSAGPSGVSLPHSVGRGCVIGSCGGIPLIRGGDGGRWRGEAGFGSGSAAGSVGSARHA